MVPGVPFAVEIEQNCELYSFCFAGSGVERVLLHYGIRAGEVIGLRGTGFVDPLVARMRHEGLQQGLAHEQDMLWSLLCQFLIELVRHRRGARHPELSSYRAAQFAQLSRIREELHHHPGRPWSVAHLARGLHLSQPRFSNLYREFFGVSLQEDLLQSRVSRACVLLGERTLTVAAVAEATGFNSHSYFCRVSQKRFGYPPGEFARRVVGEGPGDNMPPPGGV